MYTGARLTQLKHGEPLLGEVWSYDNLSGVQAAESRLEDLFLYVKNLGFNAIIDTIQPQLDSFGNLTLENNGFYGNLWPLDRRLELYRTYSARFGLNLIIEIEMPTNITDANVDGYADYIINLIRENSWILNWEILTTPENKDNLNNIKCSPKNYVALMKKIYMNVKPINSMISVGGPGIYQALIDFNNNVANNWLLEATGYYYDENNPIYHAIGPLGFLPYIDFFSIQGKQETIGLNYNIFSSIIDKLNTLIQAKLGNKLPIYSISQGWQASASIGQSLQEQGYYELREFLNCVRNSVIPFKNQLVDEYDNGNFSADVLNYGLFYYFLGNNSEKPAVEQYTFLLQSLRDFTIVTDKLEVIDPNTNVETLTLLNKKNTQSATIIWTKTINDETVVLTPHYNRTYLLPDGTSKLIINPTPIILDNFKFFIVIQNINQSTIDTVEMENLVEKKLNHTENTLINLIDLLPSSYNKEVKDVNYYKLLRAFALEMADVKIEVEKNFDNFYLNTVHNESIFNNFGVLVKLGKKPKWSYDKYRALVKGITKSLLMGPTPQSIIEALELFTNFNVNVYELYKNPTNIDSSIMQTVNPQFAFVLEIEKPIDAVVDQDELFEDVNYVINIVKPAHTLQIIIVSLLGKENYKDQYKDKYGSDYKNSDILEVDFEVDDKEGIYGYRCIGYDGQFLTNNSLTNYGLFVGPRYVLYDENQISTSVSLSEDANINEVKETFYSLTQKHISEIIDKPEDDIYSELNQTLKEYKFGISFNDCIIQTGIDTFLNQNKLAPSYKLSDLYKMDLSMFLQEKYIFRNTINTLRFNNPSNIPFNGFNSKFAPNIPDKLVLFDFSLKEHSFKKKIIRLNDGSTIEIDRLDENFDVRLDKFESYDVGSIGEHRDLSTYHVENNILDISESLSYIWDGFDIYGDVQDSLLPIQVDVVKHEFYRPRFLGPDILHVHKSISSIINNSFTVFFPETDLSNKSTPTYEAPIRVFVNGLLQTPDVYMEIISPLTDKKIIGIEFYDDGSIVNGDIVQILYIKNQEIIIGDFPCYDQYEYDVDLGTKYDTFDTLNDIDDALEVELIPLDQYDNCEDELQTIIISANQNEIYDNANDVMDIGWWDPNDAYATPFKENNRDIRYYGFTLGGNNLPSLNSEYSLSMQNQTVYESNNDINQNCIYNISLLNQTPLYNILPDSSDIGYDVFDLYNIPIIDLNSFNDINTTLEDEIHPIYEVWDIGAWDPNDARYTPFKEGMYGKIPNLDSILNPIQKQQIFEQVNFGPTLYETYNRPIIDSVGLPIMEYIIHETYDKPIEQNIESIEIHNLNETYNTLNIIDFVSEPIVTYLDTYVFTINDATIHTEISDNNIEIYLPKSEEHNSLYDYTTEDIINMNLIDEQNDFGHDIYDVIESPSDISELSNEDINTEEFVMFDGEIENITFDHESRILQNNFATALKFNMILNHGTFPSNNVLDYNHFENEINDDFKDVEDFVENIDVESQNEEIFDHVIEILNAHKDEGYLEEYHEIHDAITGKSYSDRLIEDYNVKNTILYMELFKMHNGNKTIIRTM